MQNAEQWEKEKPSGAAEKSVIATFYLLKLLEHDNILDL